MTSNLNNGRGERPSASRMTRIFNCPASFQLNAMEMPTTSVAADEGTMLHRVCELEMKSFIKVISELEKSELAALRTNLNDEQDGVTKIALDFARKEIDGLDGSSTVSLERRLWATSGLFSGKGDVVAFDTKGNAIIIDYKFGRGDVEPADRNFQLASLAVLVSDNFGAVKNVRAMIIQPRALSKDKRVTECSYDIDDINAARNSINERCKIALNIDGKREARCGYWCNYCPSSYRCKEAQNEIAEQLQLSTTMPSLAVNAENARELFEKANVVKKFCDELISKVKEYVSGNPEIECGLALVSGTKRAKLGDASAIYDAIEYVGIKPEEFVGVCSVEMGKLQTLFHSKMKDKEPKQTAIKSKTELKGLLEHDGLLTYSTTAPTLKVKEESK